MFLVTSLLNRTTEARLCNFQTTRQLNRYFCLDLDWPMKWKVQTRKLVFKLTMKMSNVTFEKKIWLSKCSQASALRQSGLRNRKWHHKNTSAGSRSFPLNTPAEWISASQHKHFPPGYLEEYCSGLSGFSSPCAIEKEHHYAVTVGLSLLLLWQALLRAARTQSV